MNTILSNRFFYYIICLSVFSFACNDVQRKEQKQIKVDSIKKDIPDYYNSDAYRKISDKQLKLMGLESLQKGGSGLQIRIWFNVVKDHLLVLSKKDSSWSAQLWTLNFNYDSVNDTLTSISKNVKDVIPGIGFGNFMDSLVGLKVLDLPDCNLLPEYFIGTDSRSTVVEIGTQSTYRIYSYADAEFHQEKFWQARNIVLIKQLIQKQFVLVD